MSKAAILGGVEPKARNYAELDDAGLIMQTFNWYSYEKERKDAHSYVRAWLKKHDAKSVQAWDRVDPNLFTPTYGWIARMVMQGSTLPESYVQRLTDHVYALIAATAPEPEPVAEPAVEPVAKKSIQAAMAEKQAEFLGEIEGEIDAFIEAKYQSSFSLYKYCQSHNTAKQYMTALTALAERRLAELAEIGEDEQVTEAYRHLGRRQVRALQTFYQNIVDDAAKYANFKKANRKPRAKKQKPAGEQVAKLKYLKRFDDLGLESCVAATMIGAQQVWVYNTKNKKLGVYHAMGSAGFSVKGTSLQGYDPEQSVQRTLRKPKEVIDRLMSAGKVALRRVLSDLSTTETALNGRFNEDVVILRVL